MMKKETIPIQNLRPDAFVILEYHLYTLLRKLKANCKTDNDKAHYSQFISWLYNEIGQVGMIHEIRGVSGYENIWNKIEKVPFAPQFIMHLSTLYNFHLGGFKEINTLIAESYTFTGLSSRYTYLVDKDWLLEYLNKHPWLTVYLLLSLLPYDTQEFILEVK